MPRSTIPQARNGWHAFLIACCLILASPISARADCTPNPGANDEPYNGYTPTGYKGAQERDSVWHREVRSRTRPDGTVEYRLRQQQTWYDSIEPINLDGRAGFQVRRNGCSSLLDSVGKAFKLPTFQRIESHYETHAGHGVLYKLFSAGLESGTYRYARFVGGRLKAVSPHEYQISYMISSLPQTYLRDGLAAIVTSPPERHGVIDLDTLEEIIPPTWQGVTGLGLLPYDNHHRYLLTDDGKTRTLYSADGRQRLLGEIDTITLIPDWFPHRAGLDAADKAIIAVTENGGQTCRLFDIHLNLLLPLTLRTEHGKCPTWRGGQPAKYYVGETFDELIHVYTLEAPASLQAQGTIPGRMATATTQGVVLARIDTPQGERYRAFSPDGKRANEQDFDEFRHLGCGFLEVRIGTKWLTLYHDGSTTEKRFYPFSC